MSSWHAYPYLTSFPPRRSSALVLGQGAGHRDQEPRRGREEGGEGPGRYEARQQLPAEPGEHPAGEGEHHGVRPLGQIRSEEHTSELQSHSELVCRLLLEKKNAT